MRILQKNNRISTTESEQEKENERADDRRECLVQQDVSVCFKESKTLSVEHDKIVLVAARDAVMKKKKLLVDYDVLDMLF
ncbi:hypothetical protein CBW65_09435 [Tumebacillus avium]|uniref:Uncharacterized protein n=1 Tax=Tumebacillus avium TaxID=1903704 RepID=A0A1Y0IL32_9BACL|nr:hypothetical protein CBW65_09435 [Tumebacillus avium]